ncbi:MAG: adenylosuccinate synthase [Kiritimatiellae bacterium]|nr:adenylosuccinate synthase [Kiritimatiellia bacterium]MDD4735219.1 adenylosuccinate synthase [Kiritimatiellia bacterium]
MPNTVLIGSQWGDEGKGKIIDVLTRRVDWVVRYQGGNNAGHTVEVGDEKYVLHLIPSGMLHEGRKCVIGNGVVIDPSALKQELDELIARGIRPDDRLFISDRAHLVFPYHRALDGAGEKNRAEGGKIGTTGRGIGPAYVDKASRSGLRMGDLFEADFEDRLRARIRESNTLLSALGAETLNEDEVVQSSLAAAETLKPYVADTVVLVNEAIGRGESVLFEGAQGTMLDIDFGTYPFVTSSSATAGGACTGAGVPPNCIDQVVGVIKAYTTRVGEGPFPTELHDADGQKLRDIGHEYGATTGRPRRCGWFDGVVARYAAMLSGINSWAMMKLDVLDAFETVRIATAYELDGRRIETVPASASALARCKPIYEEWPGWMQSTAQAKSWEDLPEKAQRYLRRLEELTGARIGLLSVGPKRASTILMESDG